MNCIANRFRPAPLTTAIIQNILEAEFDQDYGSLLFDFPKLHLFEDFKSLFHSLILFEISLNGISFSAMLLYLVFPRKTRHRKTPDLAGQIVAIL